MNRHINVTLIILLGLAFTVSVGCNVFQYFKIKEMAVKVKQRDYALRDFAIVNEIPIEYTVKEIALIKKVSAERGVPYALIMAIGMSEKGLGSHTFGVKKIDLAIMKRYPVDEWQLRQCVEIVRQEIIEFCLPVGEQTSTFEYVNAHKRAFMYQLAARYCPLNQVRWYDNVLKNWKKIEREAGK
jgi:hypothetical protein